jgi:hypothetical protein
VARGEDTRARQPGAARGAAPGAVKAGDVDQTAAAGRRTPSPSGGGTRSTIGWSRVARRNPCPS